MVTLAAIAPVTVGLVTATAYLLVRGADRNWRLGLVTAAVALVAYRSRLNPLWLLGGAAALGLTGLLTCASAARRGSRPPEAPALRYRRAL